MLREKLFSFTTVLISIILGVLVIIHSWKKQELSNDLTEVHHVKYGLFDVQEWKIKITDLILKKVDEVDMIGENRETIQLYIDEALYNSIEQLEEYINEEVRRGNEIEQFIKGVIKNVAFDAENLRNQVPQWSNNIIDVIQKVSSDPEVKQMMKTKVGSFMNIDENYLHEDLVRLFSKYNSSNKENAVYKINSEIKSNSKKLLYFKIPFLIIVITSFIVLYKIDGEYSFYSMIGILLILIVVGVSIPMLQIESKLDLFSIAVFGEEIRFENQVIFFQSKSILQVFKILLQDGKFVSIITASLIILFSIIFPISKIVASVLLIKGKSSSLIEFLCFKSSKWSMADVIVVAIFLSYIGLDSLIDTQVNSLSRSTDEMRVIASNGNSGLQFGVLVFLTFVILSTFYSIKLKEKYY